MLKLLMLVVAGLALASGEAENTFSHEVSNYQLKLHAGDEQELLPLLEEPSERSTLISNRIRDFALTHIGNMADPHHADFDTIKLTSGANTGVLYTLSIFTDNTKMHGVSSTHIPKLDFSLLRMTCNFEVWLPDIIFETDYAAELRMLLWTVHRAAGTARFMARNIDVDGSMRIGVTSGGYLQCTSLELALNIGHTHVNVTEITGVGSLDWLINFIVQLFTSGAVQDNIDNISDTATGIVQNAMNDVLKNFTLADLIN